MTVATDWSLENDMEIGPTNRVRLQIYDSNLEASEISGLIGVSAGHALVRGELTEAAEHIVAQGGTSDIRVTNGLWCFHLPVSEKQSQFKITCPPCKI